MKEHTQLRIRHSCVITAFVCIFRVLYYVPTCAVLVPIAYEYPYLLSIRLDRYIEVL